MSILPLLFKILEKLMNKMYISFLEFKNILSGSQFEFRAARSTEDVVIRITNIVMSGMYLP